MADMINVVYKNANEPIEARVKDLLSRMTIKEKLGQMTQIERSVATPAAIRDLCIGVFKSVYVYVCLLIFHFPFLLKEFEFVWICWQEVC